jgi:protoporphyrinogen oxidase
MKIAILGGGLTGIAAGYLLNKKGLEFEVLEKEKECGGLMRTMQENGFTFDIGGSHIIFSKNKDALDFILTLLGDNNSKNIRNTKVLYNGYYLKYPFENGLASLPKEETFECLYTFIQCLIRKEKGDLEKPNNLREWFYYTFGKGITEKYLIPYNEKIWKYPTENIGLDWVDRVPAPPTEDVIKSALDIETEGYKHQQYFYYPTTGGIEALIKSMESEIEGRIECNFEVRSLKKIGRIWKVTSKRNEEKTFDKVISTIPIQKLVEAVDAPAEVRNASARLNVNSLITIMLGINKERINNLSWLYLPDNSVLPHRVSFPSNYSPMVAPSGKSAVLAEITCQFGDRVWNMEENELILQTVEDLHSLGIIDKADVCFSKVKKLEYAYVINDLNYTRMLNVVREYFTNIGIDLLGRFAEFKYLNMDACIENTMNYVKMLNSGN